MDTPQNIFGLDEARKELEAEEAKLFGPKEGAGDEAKTVPDSGGNEQASETKKDDAVKGEGEGSADATAGKSDGAVDADVSVLQRELEEMRQKWQALNGRYGSETDVLKKERDELRNMVATLNQTIQKIGGEEKKNESVSDGGEFPKDIEEEYPDLAGILKKVLPVYAGGKLKALQDKVNELQERTNTLSSVSSKASAEREMEELSHGFIADNGGLDGNEGKPNKEWLDFLAQPVSDDVVREAKLYYGKDVNGLSNRDVASLIQKPQMVARIHMKFKDHSAKSAKSTPDEVEKQKALRPSIEAQKSTVKSSTKSADMKSTKPTLRMQDFLVIQDRKANSWKFGPAEKAKIDAEYDKYMEAAVEGRLV